MSSRRAHRSTTRGAPREVGAGAEFGPLPLEQERAPIEGNDEVAGAEPVFAPTDPVVSPSPDRSVDVLGGFSETSMDSLEVEPSAEDEALGDEAIAEAVRRELGEDAATADLRIAVHVRRGVVYLRGNVPEMIDADAAEEIAGRLPGVNEVVDELLVVSQQQ